jgi:hypothetical protein
MNTSLGAIPEMPYYGLPVVGQASDNPIEANAGMKWFRSNIRLGSRLALLALAIQFLLSFGHFHGSTAQAAPALLHDGVGLAAKHLDASDSASHRDASAPVPSKSRSDQEPGDEPADKCAICAVMALANAMVVATPPCLPGPQAAGFQCLIADAAFIDLNSARVAFQARAPPIS